MRRLFEIGGVGGVGGGGGGGGVWWGGWWGGWCCPWRVFDKVHFGEVVTVGAFGNELGITEGTLHDRRVRRHHGVVARPAERQDRTGTAPVAAPAPVAVAALFPVAITAHSKLVK